MNEVKFGNVLEIYFIEKDNLAPIGENLFF
jgi:hypothetical protein